MVYQVSTSFRGQCKIFLRKKKKKQWKSILCVLKTSKNCGLKLKRKDNKCIIKKGSFWSDCHIFFIDFQKHNGIDTTDQKNI